MSVDQLESSTPGLIGQLRGWITHKRYKVATVFVDHHSGLTFVYLQQSTDGEETVRAKEAFERFAHQHGVKVEHYHADNGRFHDRVWLDHVHAKGQTQSFCGVGAHHQNGVSEKRIRDLQDAARCMLLHAQRRWPQAITANLWPYAIRLAADIDNSTPRLPKRGERKKECESPIEKFSQLQVRPNLKYYHPFGCPCYVLDAAMQDRKKGPKWSERARVGIYLGQSPRHARSVALVLNPITGLVSPQYHVSFDDDFETTRKGNARILPTPQWLVRTGFRKPDHNMVPATDEPEADRYVLPPNAEIRARQPARREAEGPDLQDLGEPEQAPEGAPEGASEGAPDDATLGSMGDNEEAMEDEPPPAEPPPGYVTRAGRRTVRPERYIEVYKTLTYMDELMDEDLGANPTAPVFAATSNPDVLHYGQAMRAHDKKEFRKAMESEVAQHSEGKHWRVIPRSQVPKGKRVLPSVWAFKRKRRLATGEIYKWKARLNIHGGKQIHGVDFWETYAPVVQWTTTRFYLTVSVLNKWKCRQLDFVAAYPQAPVETETYLEIPAGITSLGDPKTNVLKIIQNIYGSRNAGRVWNKFMTRKLVDDLRFRQSDVDECLFFKGNCVVLIYVDDVILMGPDEREIDQLVKKMSDSFKISDEGTLADYLGVKMRYDADGRINMTQTHIIDSILADLGIDRESRKPRDTPALSSKHLTQDKDAPAHDRAWEYRSVIGKLNYLEKCTRPEIAYAVHQCARFLHCPKRSHSEAVERIGLYLLGTRDKGILIDPDRQTEQFECWVDAAFAGEWNQEFAETDPTTAKSRTGSDLCRGATYVGLKTAN